MKLSSSIIRKLYSRPLTALEQLEVDYLLPHDRELYTSYLRGEITLGTVIERSPSLPTWWVHQSICKVDIWFYLRFARLFWDGLKETCGMQENGLPNGWSEDRGIWDSVGDLGYSPSFVEKLAYAAGCKKLSSKFNYLVKMVVSDYISETSGDAFGLDNVWRPGDLYLNAKHVQDLKRVPVRLLKAYFNGRSRTRQDLKRVDLLVLGRVSAASAHVLVQGYEETRQLNYEMYREFRDASPERRAEMLPANMAWADLGLNPYGLELDLSLLGVGDINLWEVHPSHFDLSTGKPKYAEYCSVTLKFKGEVVETLKCSLKESGDTHFLMGMWQEKFEGPLWARTNWFELLKPNTLNDTPAAFVRQVDVKRTLCRSFHWDYPVLALKEPKSWFHHCEMYSGAADETEFFSQFESEEEMLSLEGWVFTQRFHVELYNPEGVRVVVLDGKPYRLEHEFPMVLVLSPLESQRTGRYIVSEVSHRKWVRGRGQGRYGQRTVPFAIDTVRGVEVSGDNLFSKLKEACKQYDLKQARASIIDSIMDGKEAVQLSLADAKGAGFCFLGTKQFFRAKAPYLYRLFSYASDWSEVREQDMKLSFYIQVDWSGYERYLSRI